MRNSNLCETSFLISFCMSNSAVTCCTCRYIQNKYMIQRWYIQQFRGQEYFVVLLVQNDTAAAVVASEWQRMPFRVRTPCLPVAYCLYRSILIINSWHQSTQFYFFCVSLALPTIVTSTRSVLQAVLLCHIYHTGYTARAPTWSSRASKIYLI